MAPRDRPGARNVRLSHTSARSYRFVQVRRGWMEAKPTEVRRSHSKSVNIDLSSSDPGHSRAPRSLPVGSGLGRTVFDSSEALSVIRDHARKRVAEDCARRHRVHRATGSRCGAVPTAPGCFQTMRRSLRCRPAHQLDAKRALGWLHAASRRFPRLPQDHDVSMVCRLRQHASGSRESSRDAYSLPC